MATQTRAELSQDVFLTLVSVHDRLAGEFAQFFRSHGMTMAQYNVLRILRGAGEPLPCATIAERLVHREPDVTRLLDRMEAAGLVTRERSTQDRRVVHTRLTADGRRACDELEQPALDLHAKQLKGVSVADLKELLRTLELVLA